MFQLLKLREGFGPVFQIRQGSALKKQKEWFGSESSKHTTSSGASMLGRAAKEGLEEALGGRGGYGSVLRDVALCLMSNLTNDSTRKYDIQKKL